MSFLGQDEQIREYQFRFKYLYLILAISFILLFSRLWYLQIIKGEGYRRHSEENHIKKVKIPSPRGMIFDRTKKLLIDNRPAFDLDITPQELNASKEREKTLQRLSKMISVPVPLMGETLEKSRGYFPYLSVRIKQDLSDAEVAVVDAHKLELPGVQIQMHIRRTHLYKEVAAHLMGYIGEVNTQELPRLNRKLPLGIPEYKMGDYTGKSGLESRWENILRGIDGEEYIEVDALGYRKKQAKSSITSSLRHKPSIPGKNLILTIDQDIQLVAKKAFERHGDKKVGAVIALHPKTGEILAALSEPSYDPTEFSRGITPQVWNNLLKNKFRPLRDKTIQDHYSPGSTFKVITAIAGLEEGAIDENTTFHCTGGHRVGNRVHRCWNKRGHGSVNIVQALIQSCDVFFYRLGQKLGIDTIAKYARMLGMGHPTGVNLAHEETGLIPTEEWKKQRFGQPWVAGETVSCAIGQSFVLTTPIQLANTFATIANGGNLWRPYIVKYIESSEGRIIKEFQPELISKVAIQPGTLALIRRSLAGVLTSPQGTARSQNIPEFDIAAKTGTSQVIRMSEHKVQTKCESVPFIFRDNALFIAWAPVEDPSIVVAVVAEHTCHGATGAGPIAMAVIKAYLQKHFPERYSDEAIRARLKKNNG